MNIDQLKAVREICSKGTFAKAAVELFVTQPALSMQIRSLEDEIGEPLFKKSGRRKIITPAGNMVLEHSNAILREVDALVSSLKSLRGIESGEVSIAASDTVTRYLLLDVIRLFTGKFPQIRIKIWNKTTAEIGVMLNEGKTDIGVVTLPFPLKNFETTELVSYGYVAVASPNGVLSSKKSIRLEELSKHHLLLLETGTRARDLVDGSFKAAGIIAGHITDLGSVDVQKDLARIGVGVAIVPDFAINEERKNGTLEIVSIRKIPKNTLGIITRPGSLSGATKAFVTVLKAGR